jgi:hypothetical protein
MSKSTKMPSGIKIDVKYKFSVEEIMKPEVVKLLLSKIDFSDSPSDEAADAPAAEAR